MKKLTKNYFPHQGRAKLVHGTVSWLTGNAQSGPVPPYAILQDQFCQMNWTKKCELGPKKVHAKKYWWKVFSRGFFPQKMRKQSRVLNMAETSSYSSLACIFEICATFYHNLLKKISNSIQKWPNKGISFQYHLSSKSENLGLLHFSRKNIFRLEKAPKIANLALLAWSCNTVQNSWNQYIVFVF